MKHRLKQKLKRLKVTGIIKKNRRKVQKKIIDAKGFGGEQTKKERRKKKKRKEKKEKKKGCQQHPVFPGGHPSKY